MKRILDIGAGTCCILCPSEIGARPVILVGVPVPSISGMTPTNVSTSQLGQDTPASRHCVIAPAVSGEVNGPRAKYFGRLRLANRGSGTVLDPSLTPTPTSIESKAVPNCREREHSSKS